MRGTFPARALFVGVGLLTPLAAAGSASAEGFNWTGFYAGLNAGTALSVSEDLRAHLLRVGINYRFQVF
jgi:hypothetical protein